jgi:uncharacterized protein (UPF0332 family)
MPSLPQHISQWKRNRTLLISNAHDSFPEWKIIVAFYCALHAVETLLSKRGYHPKDHSARNAFLGDRNNKLLRLWSPYKTLYDASHDARYACPAIQKRFAPAIQKDLIQTCLQTVEAAVITEAEINREEFPLLEVNSTTGAVALKAIASVPDAADPAI